MFVDLKHSSVTNVQKKTGNQEGACMHAAHKLVYLSVFVRILTSISILSMQICARPLSKPLNLLLLSCTDKS